MKSITTCPSCQTQFLVSDEQLSQYNGKVRCGHCLNVFNAVDYISVPNENQQDEIVTEHIEASTTPQTPIDIQETDIKENLADQMTANSSEIEAQRAIEIEEASTSVYEPIHDSTFINEDAPEEIKPVALNTVPETVNSTDVLKELFAQAELPLEEVRDSLPIQEVESFASYKIDVDTAQEIDSKNLQDEMSKINEFDYKPEYQYYLEQKKPTSPKLFILGGFLLLLALMQCAFFYRHSIAMQFPESKPFLVKVCQILGCKINLPKEIQLFSIDDSTIQEDANYQGVIRLSSTITNRADFNQAYPNLEVTLTDTQDHPKLRRIFKPNEYLSKAFNLEEGIAPGDSIDINMPLMADDLKPAGFRLLVSY